MFHSSFKKIILLVLILIVAMGFLVVFTAPIKTLAQNSSSNYVPLAPLPGYTDQGSNGGNLSSYLNNMFKLGIAIATGLAVIMIIIGGIQYVSTDAVGGKSEGKDRITSALWGLLLALAAYIILQTINPALLCTSLNISSSNSGATQSSAQPCSK